MENHCKVLKRVTGSDVIFLKTHSSDSEESSISGGGKNWLNSAYLLTTEPNVFVCISEYSRVFWPE